MPRALDIPDEILTVFGYDPDTGIVRRLVDGHKTPAGTIITTRQSAGYIFVTFRGRKYLVHRLAWLAIYGNPVPRFVDHINGDPSDNRIVNLRPVSHMQNMWNRKDIPSRYGKGVYKSCGRFCAQIRHNNTRTHLGTFDTQEEARAAFQHAAAQLRGQFVRGA